MLRKVNFWVPISSSEFLLVLFHIWFSSPCHFFFPDGVYNLHVHSGASVARWAAHVFRSFWLLCPIPPDVPISSRNILKWVPLSVLDEWWWMTVSRTKLDNHWLLHHFHSFPRQATAFPLERLHLGLIGLWYLWSISRLVEKWVIHPFSRQTPNSINLHMNI